MQGEYITDEAWIEMLKFFKKQPHIYVADEDKLRRFLEAIYWIARTGAQWRMLPAELGHWNAVFKRFKDWVNKGVWKDLMEYCVKDPDLEYVMIDSTIIRAHACAAGNGKQSTQGLGRSKGGFTSKIHAKVDSLGNPLKFSVTPGQKSDFTQASFLLGATCKSYIVCDKGYDSDTFRAQIINQQNIPVIPGKCNRKETIEYDHYIYKERSLIENFFAKIKYYRRIFSRFDKSIESFMAYLYFVGAILWLK